MVPVSYTHLLPHVAGIIDNLQGARVIDRALASLNGEIHRREKIFKAVGINNINDYTRKFGEEEGMELPHLIIIVDEFAEMCIRDRLSTAFISEASSAMCASMFSDLHTSSSICPMR